MDTKIGNALFIDNGMGVVIGGIRKDKGKLIKRGKRIINEL